MTGVFISSFIGNEIIISGIKGEKKMVEKTELEIQNDAGFISDIKKEVGIISNRLEKIEKKINEKIK